MGSIFAGKGRALLSCALALALAGGAVPGVSFGADGRAEGDGVSSGTGALRETVDRGASGAFEPGGRQGAGASQETDSPEGEADLGEAAFAESESGAQADEPAPCAPDNVSQPNDSAQAGIAPEEALVQTAGYLASSVSNPTVSSVGGEWAVIGLSRNGSFPLERAQAYYTNVVRKLRETSGALHRVKYTEYSRVVLALSALGFNPADVDGYNLIAPLADFDQVCWQGVNGPIWALIALDSRGYDIPSAPDGKTQTTRDKLIDAILASEIAGGGWALSGSAPDPDMTAMAVQALAPYRTSRVDVAAALSRAIDVLSGLQGEDGGYGSGRAASSESCAQVVVALTALGIDPATDARFVKGGTSVMGALLSFAVPGGGFKHTAEGDVNGMATEQGFYALVAYDRFRAGKTRLYDMSDVPQADPAPVPAPTEPPGNPATDVPGTDDSAPALPSDGAGAGDAEGANGRGTGAPSGSALAPSGKTLSLAATADGSVAGAGSQTTAAAGDDADDLAVRSQALPALSSDGESPASVAGEQPAAAREAGNAGWVWVGVSAAALCAAVGIGVCRRRLRSGAVPAGEAGEQGVPSAITPDVAGAQEPKR